MRSKLSTLITFLCLFAFSCVPNKKLVYLQKDDLHADTPKDSVLRTYELSYENYKVQPQDVLSLKFKSASETEFDVLKDFGQASAGGGGANQLGLQGEIVSPEGTVEFPLLGKIEVQGLTIFEIQEQLQTIAAQYVEDPVVSVRLLNFRVTVLGEVNNETVISTLNTRTTFMEAIAMSGGLTELADRTTIKVVRQKGNQAEVFYVNLLEEEFISSDKFYVYQNDIVIVPPLKQRPFRKYYSQNLSLILSSISTVIFIGSLISSN
jgi:polysaccharide export outer membrane protein